MISAHTPGTRRLRANTTAHGASAGLDAPDAYPFKRARITRRTFGSAAEVPIVLDSSDNDSDSSNNSASDDDLERAIVKIAKTNSLSDVSRNTNQKVRVKSKSRSKTTTKLSSKDTSHTKSKSKATSKSKSTPTAADATLALKITKVPRKAAPTTTSRLTIKLAKVAAMEAPTPMTTPTNKEDTRKSQNGATTASSEDHLVLPQASDSNSAENKIASNGISSPDTKEITLVSPSPPPPPPPPPSSDSLATVKSAAPNKVDEKLAVSIASTVSRMLDVDEPKVAAKKCIPSHVMESIPKHTADSATKSNTTSVNSLSPASVLSLTSSSAGSTPSPIVNPNDLTHNFSANSLKPSSQPIQFGDKSMNQRQIEIDKIKERIQEKIKLSQAKARERLKLKEFAKKKAREEEKNFIPVFDPSIHKSYKDIYSKSCISCAKKGRGEYCNRQQPCDICVGKRQKNCTFPADVEVAIPAKNSNRSGSVAKTSKDFGHIASSLKHENRGTRVDDTNGSVHDHDKGTAKAKSTANANGNANGNDSGSGSVSVNGNGNAVRSTLVTSTVNSKNAALEDSSTYDSGSDDDSVVKTIGSSRSGRNSRKLAKAVSYDEDEDDADVDNSDSESEGDSDVISSESEGDEDYEFQVEDELKLPRKEKRAERTRSRKSRSPSDNFERAQKILRTLEFEKRDVDVYTAGRRRRAAAATRGDYYIPSDNENPEDSGYAEAEARNEQVILSEDEEQRRLLRGELDAEYLETLRIEREKKSKPVLDESDSEEDEMFFN